VNFDLPRSTVDYVHRIGRTGRAGEHGIAISFVSAANEAHFRLIEKRNDLVIAREQIAGFERAEVAPETTPVDVHGGVKGKRKSKKDKLREAAARGQNPAASTDASADEIPASPAPASPWGAAKGRRS
jgi:ATP-dependent RNA helicase RhlE